MSMMWVGIVRMAVSHPGVHVPVRVGLAGGGRRLVLMLVVLIVPMEMLVGELVVHVLVRVTFADVQPHAEAHQHATAYSAPHPCHLVGNLTTGVEAFAYALTRDGSRVNCGQFFT